MKIIRPKTRSLAHSRRFSRRAGLSSCVGSHFIGIMELPLELALKNGPGARRRGRRSRRADARASGDS